VSCFARPLLVIELIDVIAEVQSRLSIDVRASKRSASSDFLSANSDKAFGHDDTPMIQGTRIIQSQDRVKFETRGFLIDTP
jgi:hypothetical protein